jgi:hypothetical protein
MAHKLYFTHYAISVAEYRANKPRLSPYVCNDRDAALRRARQITEAGGVAWEIESDDGTVLDRSGIADILRRRRGELAGPPKVY